VNVLFGEVGRKLAERWVSLLALPGLLFLGAGTAASVLGHRHALDIGFLSRRITTWSASRSLQSIGGATLVLATALLGSVAIGLACTALGTVVERLWTSPARHPPVSWLAERRRRRSCAAKEAADGATSKADLAGAIEAADRICLIEAERPTWIGDRLRVSHVRVRRTYGLDLNALWPRMWLIVPAETRGELEAARGALAAAARLNAWALLYLLLGAWWWPAVLVAVVLWIAAVVKGRFAAANLADLVEAAVDLYVGEIVDRVRPGLAGASPDRKALDSLLCKSRWDPGSPMAD
jgi:hypothetical protein